MGMCIISAPLLNTSYSSFELTMPSAAYLKPIIGTGKFPTPGKRRKFSKRHKR